MLSFFAVVCLSEMTVTSPGVTRIVNGVAIRVARTMGSTMSTKCPCPPPTRSYYTEAALALSW